MIGVTAGVVTLPALEIPWWNTEQSAWQVARLPERMINILPSGEGPAPELDVVSPAESESELLPREGPGQVGFWRRVSELLAAVWLLTLVAWWWTSRPTASKLREPAPVPLHKQQARHLKAARKAALAGDGAGVRTAMLEWGDLQWPDDAPRSIGVLAARVSSPLADELRHLSSQAYGPNGGDWSREALAKAIRSFSVLSDDDELPDEALPPLMPAP